MEKKKSNLLSRLADLVLGQRDDNRLQRMRIYSSSEENFLISPGTLYRLLRPHRGAATAA